MQGRSIIVASWAGNAVFALTAIPFALGVDDLEEVAVATALVLFGLSLVVWVWAFAVAFARSANGEDLAVASLFLTVGDAPKDVRWQLFGAFGACLLVTASTAAADPFGVLVPMLPFGLVGLWAARHGVFPPRPAPKPR
jgi:hypothetical protein